MSSEKSKVHVRFISDADVGFCGTLTYLSEKKKSIVRETPKSSAKEKSNSAAENGNLSMQHHKRHSVQPAIESKFSSKLKRSSSLRTFARGLHRDDESARSSNKLRSSIRLKENVRQSPSRNQIFTKTAESSDCESKKSTPLKKRRTTLSKATTKFKPIVSDSEEDYRPPGCQELAVETPTRSSKRIESIRKIRKVNTRGSPLFIESPRSKRDALRPTSRTPVKRSRKSRSHNLRNDSDTSSSSGTVERSSKLPENTNSIQSVYAKTSVRCSSVPSTPKSSKLGSRKQLRSSVVIKKQVKKQTAAGGENKVTEDNWSDLEVLSDEYTPSSASEENNRSSDENSVSGLKEISHKVSAIKKNTRTVRSDYTITPTQSRKYSVGCNKQSRVLALPSTPKSHNSTDGKQARTPATTRRKITRQFDAMAETIESDEESSSLSDAETSSSSTDSESTEEEEESEEEKIFASQNKRSMPTQEKLSKANRQSLKKNKTADVDFSYDVDADDYFLSKCVKEPTSNNQLSALEISHIEEDEVKNLLRNEYTKHADNKDLLIRKYRKQFPHWLFYLKEDFNLLLFGLGSKVEVLEYFHSEMIFMHDVLTVHGYFPRLLVKDILNSLITDILKINAPKNANEALPVIKSTLKKRSSPVFLIVHSIDRLLNRQQKHLSILRKLASFPKLHMIVSIDRINAPLLFGDSMLTNFISLNVTTYQPYVNETSYENLIYLTETGTDFVSLSSLRNIFKPLAPRVKRIFQIIAKKRLDNANNKQYKGMSFDEWYHLAKNELLAHNITVFQVQLTELVDHGIVKMNDRQCITILVKLDVLEKFYKEMYDDEEE